MKGSIIGRGAYGTVYNVTCRRTKHRFALKYHEHGADPASVRELSCLAALRGHPHVIQMIDCFVDDGKIAMLMPYVPYMLTNAIHNGHGLKYYDLRRVVQLIPLSFVAHFSVQVNDALCYMHSLNIVHRDLTPSNVLLTEDLTVKVADMGLSRQCSKWMSPTVVTEPYRAPEVLIANDCVEYTCAIDMWSLGVMIADAMEGKVVFKWCTTEHNTESTLQTVVRTPCPKDHPYASLTPWDPAIIMPNVMENKLVKRIVLGLLTFRADERLLAHELIQDMEWRQAAHMTQEDAVMVRDSIRRREEIRANERLVAHELLLHDMES